MKKIIAGQLMMWLNLIAVVIGYKLFQMTGIQSEYVEGTLGFLGVMSSTFNLFISVFIQLKGYKDGGILNDLD